MFVTLVVIQGTSLSKLLSTGETNHVRVAAFSERRENDKKKNKNISMQTYL
jgi:hypothetical protein